MPGIVLGTEDTAVMKMDKTLYPQGSHILVDIEVSCGQSIQMKKRTYLYFKSICCLSEIQIQLGVLRFYLLNLAPYLCRSPRWHLVFYHPPCQYQSFVSVVSFSPDPSSNFR